MANASRGTISPLLERWRRDGLPTYAQFDNDKVFQGAHHFANSVGTISRLCLQLNVIPIFVPPLEHGMQNNMLGQPVRVSPTWLHRLVRCEVHFDQHKESGER